MNEKLIHFQIHKKGENLLLAETPYKKYERVFHSEMKQYWIVQLFLGIHGRLVPGPTIDNKIHRSLSPIVGLPYLWFHSHGFNQPQNMQCCMYLLKNVLYKWTCAVQTHVVQGSTVTWTHMKKLKSTSKDS